MLTAGKTSQASPFHAEAEGFVLAGGQSSRMGSDKALAVFLGEPMVVHALAALRDAGLRARIAGARSDLSNFAEIVPDGFDSVGPLGGICAALRASETEWNLFLPVDMPLMPVSLLDYLVRHAQLTGASVAVTSRNGRVEPFPVVLRRGADGLLEDRLRGGERKCLSAWVALAGEKPLEPIAVELLVQAGQCGHPAGIFPVWWFQGANTPEELSRVNRLAGGPHPTAAKYRVL